MGLMYTWEGLIGISLVKTTVNIHMFYFCTCQGRSQELSTIFEERQH
jgi:hypothetical protein